jgi:type I restriction enzyme, S subunit
MAVEWDETTVGDLISQRGGSVKTGPFGTALKANEYSTEGIPLISVREVGYGTLRIDDSTPRVPPEVTRRLPEYLLSAGDIVFGRKGAVDRSAHVKPEQDGWFLGSDGIRLRLPDSCDSRFMAYQIQSARVRNWLVQHATGTTMASLNQDVIERIPIVVPPVEDQRVIAHILGTLDDKIDLNRQINETLEAIARTIFKSWFVNFDPVRAKASGEPPESICRRFGLTIDLLPLFPDRFQDSELGEIPEGWEVITLGELCERVSMGPFGSDIKTSNFVQEGVPIIRGSNLTDGFIDDDFVFLTEAKGDELRNSNARGGDIVITHRGTLGQVGLIPTSSRYPRYVVSQSQMVLTPRKERTTSRFIYEFLRSPTGQHSLLANTSQVGVPAIARPTTSVKAISLVAPPPESVRTYDSIVDPLFNRVLSATQESNSLAALRDSLLPKLLSGELHVPAGAV